MFGFGFGFSIGSLGTSTYVPTNAMAAAYIEANGFTDNELKRIIDTRIIQMAAIVDVSKISLMRFYITESTNNTTALNQCLMNVKNPATYTPTLISNNPTANYSGINYNGTNQFHQCGYNPITDSNWALNSATYIGYYYLPTSNTVVFGRRNNSIATNRQVFIQPLGISNVTINNGINDSTTGFLINPTAQDVSGFHASCRNAANNTKYYFWKTQTGTQTGVNPTAIPNVNMGFGAFTDNGGASMTLFFGEQRHEFDLFGSGFTTTQISDLQPVINGLQNDLDLLFGLTGTNARKRY